MTAKPRIFDPRSAAPVLFYAGPGIAGVPDSDLSANTLARIAWVNRGDDRPTSPDDITDKDITALVDELIATGSYSTEPVTPAEPEATS